MSDTIEVTHKGNKIEYYEHTGKWICRRWDYQHDLLSKVRDYLDKKEKQERGEFKRRKVLYSRYGSEIYEAEVTSIDDNDECWITFQQGKEKIRRREPKSKIFKMRDDFASFEAERVRLEKIAENAGSAVQAHNRAYVCKLTKEDFSQ